MRQQEPPPAVTLVMDQIVAINIRYWRRAAGMTQEELGQRLGWSPANMSAAERSADSSRDRRRFDAQQLAELCVALGVPLAALFLPPPGEGAEAAYEFTAGGRQYSMDELMMDVVMPDTVGSSSLMDAYRDRFNEAGMKAARRPGQAGLVDRWSSGEESARAREEAIRARQAADLRHQAACLADAAATTAAAAAALKGLAGQLEDGKGGQ